MSPSSSCFSFETSSTTSPFRTVALLHLGPSRVEDTTYLGRLFNLSAHSPLRDSHRTANHSSLRRPSSRASAPSASSSSTLAHSSRSLSPIWRNQPPCLKPSSPVGSWTTPSNETFSLTIILPISVLLWLVLSATNEAETARPRNWARGGRPVRPPAGVRTGCNYDKARQEGGRDGGDGDSQPGLKGAGRRWRGVPGADRAVPPGAAGALLPDARVHPGCRGRPAGHAAGCLAGPGRVPGTRLAPHLAVPDRHQPVPQGASLGQS